jgi:hypothetical protein
MKPQLQQSHVDTYHDFHRAHRNAFGSRARSPLTATELSAQRKERASASRSDRKRGQINVREWLHDQDRRDAMKANPKAVPVRVTTVPPAAARRRHASGVRSSAASGDGNSDDGDSDPARPLLSAQLFDQASLAALLCVSKKTIQNLFSKTPWLLPPAIFIPGARGPRWTLASVQAWISDRPLRTSKPAPKATTTSRKVGRPRIVASSAGVQS